MRLGQIAGGDAAIHADIGHRPVYPLLEVLAFRVGIVFPPVAAALPGLPLSHMIPPGAGCGLPGPGIGG